MSATKRSTVALGLAAAALVALPLLSFAEAQPVEGASKPRHERAAIKRAIPVQVGKLTVKDSASRTFTMRCPTCTVGKVYTAPAGTDVASLSGKRVRVVLDASGNVSSMRNAEAAAHAAASRRAAGKKD